MPLACSGSIELVQVMNLILKKGWCFSRQENTERSLIRGGTLKCLVKQLLRLVRQGGCEEGWPPPLSVGNL
jgi:hypothetical protein